MIRSKRLSYIPKFEDEKDYVIDNLKLEFNDQAMEIDGDCDDLGTRDNTENEKDDGEVEMMDLINENNQVDDIYDEIDDEEGDDEGSDTVFPLISEPLKTYVTVNPATLEDEELWPLSSLKSLCEYVGLSVKGNRRCILSRLQAWNGAPLSGAGHPDSYDTRSARFHTVPMAFLEKNKIDEKSKTEYLGFDKEKDRENLEVNNSLNDSTNAHESGRLDENEGGHVNLKSFHSPCIIKKMESLTSTPVTSFRREIKSCLNTTSTPRKKSTNTFKSGGRICFSPYNHVRVFVSNPGERELNMDPDSILRLIDDYDYDDFEEDDNHINRSNRENNSRNKETNYLVNEDYIEEKNINFWNNSESVFASND